MFNFFKSRKREKEILATVSECRNDIRDNIILLTVFQNNKKNRLKWATKCYKTLNSVDEIRPGKPVKLSKIVDALAIDEAEFLETFNSLKDSYPSPMKCEVSLPLSGYKTYTLWLGMRLTNEPLNKDEVVEMLLQSTKFSVTE